LGDLALAEGVEERIVDRLSRQSVARRLVAIESERERCARCLLVCGHVVREARPPTVKSSATCMNNFAPSTLSSCGSNRAII